MYIRMGPIDICIRLLQTVLPPTSTPINETPFGLVCDVMNVRRTRVAQRNSINRNTRAARRTRFCDRAGASFLSRLDAAYFRFSPPKNRLRRRGI